MTTNLPPQGSFQQHSYQQSSHNTPSFPSSINQTAYFSPKMENNYINPQFANQPVRRPARNLSPNFGLQPQRMPQNMVRNPSNSRIPYQYAPDNTNHVNSPAYYGQYQQQIPYSGQHVYQSIPQQQPSYLPTSSRMPMNMNLDPRLYQGQTANQGYPYQQMAYQQGGYQQGGYQQGGYQQQIPSAMFMQPFIGKLPQKSINKKFDYDQANFDVDYRIQQNLIHCVICNQVYKISQKLQHLQRHRQKIRNIDIKPVNQSQIKRLQKYNKLVRKGLITKPIVQPEQFNIQYDPNQYILNKMNEYYDPNEPSIKQIQVQTEDPSNFSSSRQQSMRPPTLTNNQSFNTDNNSNQYISNEHLIVQQNLRRLNGRQAVSGTYEEDPNKTIPSQMQRQTNRERFDRDTINKQEPTFLVQKLENSSLSGQNLNSRGSKNPSLPQSLGYREPEREYEKSNVQSYKSPIFTNSQLLNPNDNRASSSTVNQYRQPQSSSVYRTSQNRQTTKSNTSMNRQTAKINANNNRNSQLYDIRQEQELVGSNSNMILKKQNSIKMESVVKQALFGGDRSSNNGSFS